MRSAADALVIVCSFWRLAKVCVGLYFPSIGTLRAKYIPDANRGVVLNLFAIPLNLIVISVFTMQARRRRRRRLGCWCVFFGDGFVVVVVVVVEQDGFAPSGFVSFQAGLSARRSERRHRCTEDGCLGVGPAKSAAPHRSPRVRSAARCCARRRTRCAVVCSHVPQKSLGLAGTLRCSTAALACACGASIALERLTRDGRGDGK